MLYSHKYNILNYSDLYYVHGSTHISNIECGFNTFIYVFNSENLKIMLLFRIHRINDIIKKNRSTLTRFGQSKLIFM